MIPGKKNFWCRQHNNTSFPDLLSVLLSCWGFEFVKSKDTSTWQVFGFILCHFKGGKKTTRKEHHHRAAADLDSSYIRMIWNQCCCCVSRDVWSNDQMRPMNPLLLLYFCLHTVAVNCYEHISQVTKTQHKHTKAWLFKQSEKTVSLKPSQRKWFLLRLDF